MRPAHLPDAEAVATHLLALGAALRAHEPLWRHPPADPPPALRRWLDALPDARVDALERDPRAEDAPDPWREWVSLTRSLGEVGPLPGAPPAPAAPPEGVKARKWRQIDDLAPRLRGRTGARVVDWCGGKGHLGRTAARAAGCPLCVVERDPVLADEARALAAAEGVAVEVRVADVLAGPVPLRDGDALVALHACGDLTDAALDAALAADAVATLVPCCFHRVADDRAPDLVRPPRSRLAATVDPGLDWRALRLPGRTDGCSRAARNEARVRAMAWRLALDALFDVPAGARSDRVGRTPRAWGRDGFAAWAERVAARDGLSLPSFDAAAAEAAGFQLLAHERRRGLARTLFRRPIALWWVLDRAQAAAEAGRAVAVGEITPAAITPRNVALLVDPPGLP